MSEGSSCHSDERIESCPGLRETVKRDSVLISPPPPIGPEPSSQPELLAWCVYSSTESNLLALKPCPKPCPMGPPQVLKEGKERNEHVRVLQSLPLHYFSSVKAWEVGLKDLGTSLVIHSST